MSCHFLFQGIFPTQDLPNAGIKPRSPPLQADSLEAAIRKLIGFSPREFYGRAEGLQLCKTYGLQSVPLGTSLVAQMVKNLPAMQETWATNSHGESDVAE